MNAPETIPRSLAPTSPAPAALETLFGHRSFRHGQEDAVNAVLAGRDCIAVLPTGAGKTVIFQLPARVLGGTTVVVSPLVSLMQDQVGTACARGLDAIRLGGATTSGERAAQLSRLTRGRAPELVYAAPEGLAGRNLEALGALSITRLAVDEAHCADRWGGTFRPDYLRLGEVRGRLGDPPCVAVTASASPSTQRAVRDILRMRAEIVVRTSCLRRNLVLRAWPVRDAREGGDAAVAYVLGAAGPGIVYTRSRDGADATAALLRRRGCEAESYHAGLEPDERSAIQEGFLAGRTRVVVATVAFGMGIDKADVRWVVHHGLPESVDSYYQEVGRAGRDGEPSDCLLLWSPSDLRCHDALRRTIEEPARRHAALMESDAMLRYAAGSRCRHAVVAEWFGEVLDPCGEQCDVCDPNARLPGPLAARRRSMRAG